METPTCGPATTHSSGHNCGNPAHGVIDQNAYIEAMVRAMPTTAELEAADDALLAAAGYREDWDDGSDSDLTHDADGS